MSQQPPIAQSTGSTPQLNVQACKNCGAQLTGPWCSQCGQKHLNGAPTLGLFLEEFITALIHADSRFWRTLWALIAKPGFLAREFFDGRRASYLPPIRLYLGLSLVFFLFLSLDVQRNYPTAVSDDDTAAAAARLDTDVKSALQEALREKMDESAAPALEPVEVNPSADESETAEICQPSYTGPHAEWLVAQLQHACRQIQQDSGYSLAQSFMAKLPTAMFLLMPLFAVCMKLWYWQPARYFTEHLVLQINNHSAIFLFVLVGNLTELVVGGVLAGWVNFAIACYVFVYCYKSLRVYYDQEKWLTRFKFFSLMLVYSGLVMALIVFTGLASLFSVI